MCYVLPVLIKRVNSGHCPGHSLAALTYQSIHLSGGRQSGRSSHHPDTRLGTICCVTAIPVVVRQDLKPFFFDTEIKGNPDKFKLRSNTVLWPDELLARKSPRAGWGSWAAHRNRPLQFCRFSRQHHITLSEPILGLYVNSKNCANWLQISQINTIFFNLYYYTAARHRYLQTLSWEPTTSQDIRLVSNSASKKALFPCAFGTGLAAEFQTKHPCPMVLFST